MKRTLVIFSQVFVPDPASVGQHIADVAFEMRRRGYRVRVYTADRGYDDPTQRYPRHEIIHGVEVCRMAFSSFGKKSILTRILGTVSFMLQALIRGLFTPNVDAILFSTSPPMIGIIATLIHIFRGVPAAYWAMDLNPDQLIALKKIKESSLICRSPETANRTILSNTNLIIALDRFMASRLRLRGRLPHKIKVIPPWPHEQAIESLDHAQNPFRTRHNLDGKFVIMYSGNHSPSNPLRTLLEAAEKLKADTRIQFLFVGGGIGKKEVEQFIREQKLPNALSLPYQPLAGTYVFSLSAADVHVVSLGTEMVGIIHPCKIYGAMAVARPILFFGPKPSHVSDLLDIHHFGSHVSHGDVAAAINAAIQSLPQPPRSTISNPW